MLKSVIEASFKTSPTSSARVMISQVRTRSASNSLQNFKSTNHDCNCRLDSAVQLFILQLFSTKKKVCPTKPRIAPVCPSLQVFKCRTLTFLTPCCPHTHLVFSELWREHYGKLEKSDSGPFDLLQLAPRLGPDCPKFTVGRINLNAFSRGVNFSQNCTHRLSSGGRYLGGGVSPEIEREPLLGTKWTHL